jgi:hypothetical protein
MKQTYSSWLTRQLPRPLAALGLLVALALLRPLGASAQSTVSTLASSGTAGFADGAGSTAQFNGLYGVAVDGAGIVYVADYNNQRIRKVTPVAPTLTTISPNPAAVGNQRHAHGHRPDGGHGRQL